MKKYFYYNTAHFSISGLEWNNPDLEDNYNKDGSWDFNGNDDDPMPDGRKGTFHMKTVVKVPNKRLNQMTIFLISCEPVVRLLPNFHGYIIFILCECEWGLG